MLHIPCMPHACAHKHASLQRYIEEANRQFKLKCAELNWDCVH